MTDPTSLRVFGQGDGDLSHLRGQTVAFVGYGNQGRAQALNLRDSLRSEGIEASITISALRDKTWQHAERDGFDARSVADAVTAANVVFLLIPDEVLAEVFAAEIAPNLTPNASLVFASGYNLFYEAISVPDNVDVVLLAPRMIGEKVRELYERGEGYYSYLAVEQDASGDAWNTLLALAKGIGTLRLGALEISAKQETIIDLFMEQGYGALFGRLVFETLAAAVEAGMPAEAMILELYLSGEMAETMHAMAEHGFVEQSRLHSPTSQYGGMTRSLRVDREALRKHLLTALEEISSGAFAKEWAEERASGYKNFENLRALGTQHNPFTPAEHRLRELLESANKEG